MKKVFIYIMAAALSFGLTSCDKIFDNLEGDLSKVGAETLLSSEAGLKGILANLYGYIPMGELSSADRSTFFAQSSRDVPSYGKSGIPSWWNYTQMRSINKFLEALDSALEKKIITESNYKIYKGEALFIRAYCYYAGVLTYGGMPIVEKSLDNEAFEDLFIPRSTEKDTWDWVIAQLDDAIALLPEQSTGGNMRANKYSALGLQTRVALSAASISKFWNVNHPDNSYKAVQQKLTYMEASYADAYYQKVVDAAGTIISSGKYGLFGGTTPGSIEAAKKNLIDLFQTYQFTEGLFGKSYKSGSATTGNNQDWGPNQLVNGYLVGRGSATLNIADEYDYYASATNRTVAGRQIITKNSGSEDYYLDGNYWTVAQDMSAYKRYNSVDEPFVLKDARFQAWFIYPGTTYANTVINIQGGWIKPDGTVEIYPAANGVADAASGSIVGIAKNGETYYPYGGMGELNSGFYKITTEINATNRYDYAFGQRKMLDEGGYNQYAQTPWYDIRYAEILLSYAEAYAESGKGDAAVAKKALNDVRRRAGFTDEIAVTVDNVMHEWKVEFPFENKWQQVLHRRRAYYDKTTSQKGDIEWSLDGKKFTLIPMVDLSGAEVKYVFPRAVSIQGVPDKAPNHGNYTFGDKGWYSGIPNHAKNQLQDNNTINGIVEL